MSDSTESTPHEGGEFTPITSQEDLNRVIGERVKRATAKYADYGDLKTKAAELDELKQAGRTEVEKAQARIAELETQMQTAQREALRRRIAGDNGITDADDIDLFLTGQDEETLTRQAKRLAAREADRKKNGNRVPREGTNTSAPENENREFVSGLFGGSD